jgi:hypothetical protein
MERIHYACRPKTADENVIVKNQPVQRSMLRSFTATNGKHQDVIA